MCVHSLYFYAHERTAELHSNGFSACEFFMRYLNITLYATFTLKRFELFHKILDKIEYDIFMGRERDYNYVEIFLFPRRTVKEQSMHTNYILR